MHQYLSEVLSIYSHFHGGKENILLLYMQHWPKKSFFLSTLLVDGSEPNYFIHVLNKQSLALMYHPSPNPLPFHINCVMGHQPLKTNLSFIFQIHGLIVS